MLGQTGRLPRTKYTVPLYGQVRRPDITLLRLPRFAWITALRLLLRTNGGAPWIMLHKVINPQPAAAGGAPSSNGGGGK